MRRRRWFQAAVIAAVLVAIWVVLWGPFRPQRGPDAAGGNDPGRGDRFAGVQHSIRAALGADRLGVAWQTIETALQQPWDPEQSRQLTALHAEMRPALAERLET